MIISITYLLYVCRLLKKSEDIEVIDYKDTFLDVAHVVEAFPTVNRIVFKQLQHQHNQPTSTEQDIVVKDINDTTGVVNSALPSPPYIIEIKEFKPNETNTTTTSSSSKKKRKSNNTTEQSTVDSSSSTSYTELIVKSYIKSNRGPYPEDIPPSNMIRYTPRQIEAIRSGTNPGLTMIVGPPGTGKTDVAVQIIVNLYHNNPNQKILIVTHSNAALNDLFEKIMARDVAPRHLLRLGSGELELRETLSNTGAAGSGRGQGEIFSKQGRVNWSLSRRLQLLAQVQRLSASLHVVGDVGNTCETAAYFQLEQIKSRIEKFYIDINAKSDKSHYNITVQQLFPFNAYFSDVNNSSLGITLFTGDWLKDIEIAQGCFVHINRIFEELADYRAFELLRTQSLRSDFLLTKQVLPSLICLLMCL